MSLDVLMETLRANTEKIRARRAETDMNLQQAAASMIPRGAGRSASGGRASGGGGRLKGKSQGLFNGKWPAMGNIDRHDGYSWTKWAGDINMPGSQDYGNPVVAYRRGRVVSVQHLKDSYGNNIVIQHPNGTKTRYAHLSKTRVRPGMRVKRGQRIGRVGSTGNSSGPHLHFEIF